MSDSNYKNKIKKVFIILTMIVINVFGLSIFSYFFNLAIIERKLDSLIIEHSAAIFGLPISALASFFIVILLELKTGPIKFEFLHLDFMAHLER